MSSCASFVLLVFFVSLLEQREQLNVSRSPGELKKYHSGVPKTWVGRYDADARLETQENARCV